MIKSNARRFALALMLVSSPLAVAGIAAAQSTTTPPTGSTPNGVTGTDPVPKGCGCGTGSTSTHSAPATTSTSGSLTQALLLLLGVG